MPAKHTPRISTGLSLDEIASDPEVAATLSPDVARALLARCVVVQARLISSTLTPVAINSPPGRQGPPIDDRLLDVEEAAAKLAVSKDWLYRHAAKLPFTVRLGPRRLRFSDKGIDRFIQHRQGRA
jgi:predicted DNA-binding transcriptional regulator AlpA